MVETRTIECQLAEERPRFRTRSMYSARGDALQLAAATSLSESSLTATPHSDNAIPHFLVRFFGIQQGSGILFKHAFTRYCALTIDSLVKCDHGPSAEGPVSFHATPWTLCDALVASEGRLGP